MWKTKLCLGIGSQFGEDLEAQLALFCRTGFEGFFVDWTPDRDLARLRARADELGMLFQSVHAPFGKAARMWMEGECAQEAVDELLRCLEDCAANGVPLVVCHCFIGFDDHTPTSAGIVNYGKVVDRAQQLGLRIAFENTEGEEYLQALMEAFDNRPHVGFCWDTGHELCYNRGKDMTALYGDRLFGTHLNDNLGIKAHDGTITWLDDLHLLPFDGITDWQNVADRLCRCGFDGPLTFELTVLSKPDRHENDVYAQMGLEQYVAEAYKRACRVAALVHKSR